MVTRRNIRSRRDGNAAGSAHRGTGATQRPVTRSARRGSNKKQSGMPSWAWWVGGIVLSVIISLVFSLNNKSRDNADVQKEMIEVVETFPNYSEHADYYKQLVRKCHQQAFEATYTMSKRRTSAKLDAEKYVHLISAAMASQAQKDGQIEVADMLLLFNSSVK